MARWRRTRRGLRSGYGGAEGAAQRYGIREGLLTVLAVRVVARGVKVKIERYLPVSLTGTPSELDNAFVLWSMTPEHISFAVSPLTLNALLRLIIAHPVPQRSYSQAEVYNMGASNMKRTAFEATNNLGTKSLLLDLPPELRNNVYDYVAESEEVRLYHGMVIQAPLALTSHQLRKEYGPIFENRAVVRAKVVTARVIDLDFGAQDAIWDDIPPPTQKGAGNMSAIVPTSTESERRKADKIVTIIFSLSESGSQNFASLRSWLDLCRKDQKPRHIKRIYRAEGDWCDDDNLWETEPKEFANVIRLADSTESVEIWVAIARAVRESRRLNHAAAAAVARARYLEETRPQRQSEVKKRKLHEDRAERAAKRLRRYE